jgi:hypothetical protein
MEKVVNAEQIILNTVQSPQEIVLYLVVCHTVEDGFTFLKGLFQITHETAICCHTHNLQSEIPALPDSWCTNTPLLKMS